MDNPIFNLHRLVGLENDNPKMHRITLEFDDIIKTGCIEMPEETLQSISYAFFDIEKEFIKLEKFLLNYFKIVNETFKKLKSGTAVTYTHNTAQWDNPSYQLHDIFRDFLMTCAIILRYRTKISKLAFNDSKLEEHKYFRKFINEQLESKKEKLGEEAFLATVNMLNEDRGWLSELIRFRDQAEHVENETLQLTDFSFTFKTPNDMLVTPPMLAAVNKSCRNYMAETFYNLYTFMEDFIAMIFNLLCIEHVEIIKVKNDEPNDYEDKPNDLGNYEYRINLKQNLLKRLVNDSEKH